MRTDYNTIMDILEDYGACNDCDELTVECYCRMLESFGYPGENSNGKTVGELAEIFPDDILLVRIDGHLTCVINGCCYDIWDCTDKTADRYWVID